MEYVQLSSTLARRAVSMGREAENYHLESWAMGVVVLTVVAFVPLIIFVSQPGEYDEAFLTHL